MPLFKACQGFRLLGCKGLIQVSSTSDVRPKMKTIGLASELVLVVGGPAREEPRACR
jgi:hypothetical protein